jgi:hypothetical protein
MLDEFFRSRKLSLDAANGIQVFLNQVASELRAHTANPALIHGLRTQTMFAYVAAALGRCSIITEEDSGEFFTGSPEMKRPDFRVLTKQGEEFFVEVKNFHQTDPLKPYVLKCEYANNIQKYADAFRKPLLFAIYWTRWGIWTLNALGSFTKAAKLYSISLGEALKSDQKRVIGDCFIGIPKPLSLRFYTDPNRPRKIDSDGHAEFAIQRVTFVVAVQEIKDAFEERLSWFFFRYGAWQEMKEPAQVVNGEVIYFELQPARQDPNPEQLFISVGPLSSMLSRRFNELTADKDGDIRHLCPAVDPKKLGVLIPENFKGEVMRIWRFTLQPDLQLPGLGQLHAPTALPTDSGSSSLTPC